MKMLKMPFYINGGVNMNQCARMKLSEPSITNTMCGVFRK